MENKNMNPLLKETIVFRPIKDCGNSTFLRYADGAWIPDDGKPDLAFYDIIHPYAYGVELPYYINMTWSWHDLPLTLSIIGDEYKHDTRGWHTQTINNIEPIGWDDREKHPNYIAYKEAMNKCCETHLCANGRSFYLTGDEYDIPNPYLEKGLVWIQRTMQPIKRPNKPICYQCVNDGLGHKQEAFEHQYRDYVSDVIDAQKRLDDAQSEVYDCEYEIKRTNEKLAEMKLNPFYKPEFDNDN